MKKYDELSSDEKELIDTIRSLKLSKDHAKFSLYSFQLQKLISDYEELKSLRQSIQLDFFNIFENIKKDNLLEGDIYANEWAYNRENENNVWNNELDFILEIKNSLDYAIELIESGEAEKTIINKEHE